MKWEHEQKISNKNLPFKETEIVIPCENAINNEECKHTNDNSLKDQISVKESSMNANVSEANTDISNYTDVKSTTADSGHKIADSQDTVNLDLKDTSNKQKANVSKDNETVSTNTVIEKKQTKAEIPSEDIESNRINNALQKNLVALEEDAAQKVSEDNTSALKAAAEAAAKKAAEEAAAKKAAEEAAAKKAAAEAAAKKAAAEAAAKKAAEEKKRKEEEARKKK